MSLNLNNSEKEVASGMFGLCSSKTFHSYQTTKPVKFDTCDWALSAKRAKISSVTQSDTFTLCLNWPHEEEKANQKQDVSDFFFLFFFFLIKQQKQTISQPG